MAKLHKNPLAVTYAQSLLELANERRLAEETSRELQGIGDIMAGEPVFAEYLSDPAVSRADRTAAIERIFLGRVSELVYGFLGVLNEHGRMALLPQALSAFADLLDAQQGNVDVDVTSAQRLAPDELEQVRQSVGQALGKNAVVHQYVDDSIIGGLVIRVGDKVIDASVQQQLRSMRHQLHLAAQKVRN
jgi:F-type H+-transporting ATPase subunit delta